MKRALLLIFAISLCSVTYAYSAPKVSYGNNQPTTCNPANGDFWIDTNGTAGNRLYICTGTNTYTINDGLASTKAPALGADDNYVTDSEKIKLSNLTGTNTGDQNAAGVSVADAGGYYTGTNVEAILQEIGLAGFGGGSVDLSAYLSKTNTTAFTPSGDYQPATKKYVDDSITAGGGYTDEQAQDAVCLMLSGNTETGITVTCDDVTGKINFVSPTTLASFTDDATHRLVTDTEKTTWNAKQNTLVAGTDYLAPTGSASGLTGFPTLNQNTTGSAAKLTTARTIGGVSFDGSANINLPGVNAAGNQNTTGNAGTATAFAANPTDCTAGQYATTIAANGNLTCGQVAYSQLSGTPTLGTAAALNVGTSANNIVQLNSSGELPFTLDLMDLTSGGTAISPPGTSGYALTANTSGVITWAAMSGGMATTDIDTSAELDTIVTDDTGSGALVFATSPTLVTPALGTPSALVLTNATGLPLSSVVDSTTEPLGAGTIELGAASDTTIARSGAGVLTVEGVTVTRTIASNATALGTSAIGSGACATVSATATGTASTDTIGWGFNGDPTSTTGYQASANGMLTIVAYPTANNVNFKVCNNTAASITPGAVTLNWKVFR